LKKNQGYPVNSLRAFFRHFDSVGWSPFELTIAGIDLTSTLV
jgi:hypothetical protein